MLVRCRLCRTTGQILKIETAKHQWRHATDLLSIFIYPA